MVLSKNCLLDYHLLRLGDLTAIDLQILALRGIGVKGTGEIARILHRNGITGTAWDLFLPE